MNKIKNENAPKNSIIEVGAIVIGFLHAMIICGVALVRKAISAFNNLREEIWSGIVLVSFVVEVSDKLVPANPMSNCITKRVVSKVIADMGMSSDT